MRYSSENFSDFEFHDAELYFKDCENSNLRLTARYLNIHKEAEENPYDCDMETDCAEILLENADITLFETMEAYIYGYDGSEIGFEPRTVREGGEAADRLIDELKKGLSVNCVNVGSDKDGTFFERHLEQRFYCRDIFWESRHSVGRLPLKSMVRRFLKYAGKIEINFFVALRVSKNLTLSWQAMPFA